MRLHLGLAAKRIDPVTVERRAWFGVVQHPDGETTEELVTIEETAGRPPVIELTDGTRITCVDPAGENDTPSST
jgi:hypothetical protein